MIRRFAILLDMDGVLLDSESLIIDSWMKAAAELGITLSREILLRTVGIDRSASEEIIRESIDGPMRFSLLESTARGIYQRAIDDGIPVKAGARPLLGYLQTTGIPVGLVTSTSRDTVERMLKPSGILPFFTIRAHGDEVERCKPAPDIYLLASIRIGIPPERCIAVEDSYSGLRAAKSAGMHTIMIPDLLPPTSDSGRWTDRVLGSLAEVLGNIDRLFEA